MARGQFYEIYKIMFIGQNILPDFPEALTKVINFLNERASSGEFVFSDSFSEWESKEDIIDPIGLGIDGDNYYFAVSLAYLANLNNGHLIFPEKAHIGRWAWSLQLLAEVADWDADYMDRVIRSFLGKKDDVNELMGSVAQTYARKDFDKGLALQGKLQELHTNISAGLMENDFRRYCELFPPKEHQEDFTKAYSKTYELQQDAHEKAFDQAMTFENLKSVDAMAFLLKEHIALEGERKGICAERIKDVLQSGSTSDYTTAVTNWLIGRRDDDAFTEEIVLMLIEGLGTDGSKQLMKIDNAVGLRYKKPELLAKILVKVAESVSPLAMLKMEHILHRLNDDRRYFSELAVALIIHPQGEYRVAGRRLWDEFHLESTDFNAAELNEMTQCVFVLSMLQDFGNPETRLPKVLPLLKTRNTKVKKFVMGILRPYTDDYMGHVVAELDKLKINNKEAKNVKAYVDGRWNVIKLRKEMKELSPAYTYGKEYREARRSETEYFQSRMKEAEKSHHALWKELASTVILARSGGWRMADGTTQKLPLIQFSMPARQLNESLSPREQENWLKDILRDWNDTTGDH